MENCPTKIARVNGALLIRKNYGNYVIKGVLYLTKLRFPHGKNAETFFQRELLLYVLLLIINFMSNF